MYYIIIKIKGITIKLTNKNYELIKLFCKENNFKMSDVLNIKIYEIIKEIEESTLRLFKEPIAEYHTLNYNI